MNDRPREGPRRTIETAWHIDRNDRFAGRVHGLNRCRRFTIKGTRQPSAKECVDDKIGFVQHMGRQRLCRSLPSLRHHRSVSFKSIDRDKDPNTRLDTAFAEIAGRHKPIAAIVTWTAKDGDTRAAPSEPPRFVCNRTASVFH